MISLEVLTGFGGLDFLDKFKNFIPILRTLIIIIVLFVIFKIIIGSVKRRLLSRTKNKKQLTNIKVFSRVLEYFFLVLLIIFAIFSYVGSWEGLGIGLGLFTAALGFALQRPIAGIVAWLIIVLRKPFSIGDRINIENVTGDVIDITLTHIHLGEVGGHLSGYDSTGLIVLIPNFNIFEKNVINYTMYDDFMLDQVIVSVTYESDLDKAIKIILDSAKKCLKEVKPKERPFPRFEKPYTRLAFQASGIDIKLRYSAPVRRLQEISSEMTKEIYDRFKKTRNVEFAYPHTEVILKR